MHRKQISPEQLGRSRALLAGKSKQMVAQAMRETLDDSPEQDARGLMGRSLLTRTIIKVFRSAASFFRRWGVRQERVRQIVGRAMAKRERQHRDPHRRCICKLARAHRAVQRNPSSRKARSRLARIRAA